MLYSPVNNVSFLASAHGLILPAWGVLPLDQNNQSAIASSLATCASSLAIALPSTDKITIQNNAIIRIIHNISPFSNYFLSPDSPGEIVEEGFFSEQAYRQKLFRTLDPSHIELCLEAPKLPNIKWAKLSNIEQTDLNSSVAGTEMQFDAATLTGNSIFFADNPGGLQVLQSGNYMAIATCYATAAAGSRQNVAIRICVNGLAVSDIGAGNYIRRNSGHNEASTNVQEPLTLSAGDIVGIKGYLWGNTGVVTTPAGESSIKLNIINN